MIHYVGALGGAEANARYYGSTPGIGASAHYFVGHGPAAEVWASVAEGDSNSTKAVYSYGDQYVIN